MLKDKFHRVVYRLLDPYLTLAVQGDQQIKEAAWKTITHHGILKSMWSFAVRKTPPSPVFNPDGSQDYLDRELKVHRDGGPARIMPDGTQYWVRHGRKHRDEGPAVVYPHNPSKNEWWRDGKRWHEGRQMAEDKQTAEATILQSPLCVKRALRLKVPK